MRKLLITIIIGLALSNICVYSYAEVDSQYCAKDMAVVNALIENNGLKAIKDDAVGWAENFLCWDESIPKRIIFLNLDNKSLYGKVNLEGLDKLASLNCSDNQISELTLKNLQELVRVDCYQNRLMELDITNCSMLRVLDCSNNLLKALDVSICKELELLWCSDNSIQVLDISGLNKLESVDCKNNDLSELSVSGKQELNALYCGGNNITELDLTGTPRFFDVVAGDIALQQILTGEGNRICVVPAIGGRGYIAYYYRYAGEAERENILEEQVLLQAESEVGYSFIGWDENGEIITNESAFHTSISESRKFTPIFVKNTSSIEELPQTGDNSHIALWLVLLMLAGTATLILKRKTA